jgi:hypothetical protein
MKQEETIRVRYIGPKPQWADKSSLHGSGLTFVSGQVREVPAKLGKSFLRHQDLFERASNVGRPPKSLEQDDTAERLEAAKEAKLKEDEAMHRRLDLMDRIDTMDRAALMSFVKINYRQSLKPNESTNAMRDHARELVDRFGIVGDL